MFPPAAYLEFNVSGFRMVVLFRSFEILWSNISEIGVLQYGKNQVVAWKYTQAFKSVSKGPLSTAQLTTLRYRAAKMNKAWIGWDAALPDTYGMSALDLANLMNDLKKQYKSR
jgi:hypothetical protein